jgi:hypothetical protein
MNRGDQASTTTQRAMRYHTPATGSDAEWTQLHAALVVAGEQIRRIEAEGDDDDYDERVCEADSTWFSIMDQIEKTPTRTMVGLRVKADALRLLLYRFVCTGRGETLDDIASLGDPSDGMALSLVRDILARGDAEGRGAGEQR